MAISDICNVIKQDNFRVDVNLESKIVNAVLERLEKDKQNDVQSISVKWYVYITYTLMSYIIYVKVS